MSTLGRPTRDVDGFWQYAIWNQETGAINQYPSKEWADRVAASSDPSEGMVVIRRWVGGWQAVEEDA
jgi:hypothetical protein